MQEFCYKVYGDAVLLYIFYCIEFFVITVLDVLKFTYETFYSTPCPEKRGHSIICITLTNLDSFVIFGMSHHNTSVNH